MSIRAMNHFTVLSVDLAATERFYCEMLDMRVGARPLMSFPGLWLYAGDQPILHVIGVERLPEEKSGVIDHMAFSAVGLRDTVRKLEARGIKHRLKKREDGEGWQLFCRDPNGAMVELDFEPTESAPDA